MTRLLTFIAAAALSAMTVSAQGTDPVSGTHTGVDAQGNPTLIEFTAAYDGKDYPIKGYADWDSIALKRIDAFNTEFTQSYAGKVTLSAKRVVSRDGKTMTITGQGASAKGERVDLLLALEKR